MIEMVLNTAQRRAMQRARCQTPLRPLYTQESGGDTAVPVGGEGQVVTRGEGGALYCLVEEDFTVSWKRENDRRYMKRMYGDGQLMAGWRIDETEEEGSCYIDWATGELTQVFGKETKGIDACWDAHGLYQEKFDKALGHWVAKRDLATLEEVWRADGVGSSRGIAVADGVVIVKHDSGVAAGLDASTGEELWRVDPVSVGLFASWQEVEGLEDDLKIEGGRGQVTNRRRGLGYPHCGQGVAVVPMPGNHLVGVSLATGERRWVIEPTPCLAQSRYVYCDELYVLGSDRLRAYALSDGELIRETFIDTSDYADTLGDDLPTGNFAVSETHVFLSSLMLGPYFVALNKNTGKVEWLYEAENTVSSRDQPYVRNGRVYFGCLGRLYVFEGADGYVGDQAC